MNPLIQKLYADEFQKAFEAIRAMNAQRLAEWEALPWHEKVRLRVLGRLNTWRWRVRDAWLVLIGRAEIE